MKMLRIVNIARVSPALVPFLDSSNKFDKNLAGSPQPSEPKSGIDRLKRMYFKNEYDEVSPELTLVVQTAMTGCIAGACFGGFIKSRQAFLYFIENNQASIFKSTMDAKKKLQDYVTIAFAKGAVHWGWRLGFFVGTFSLVSSTISVYRNDTSVLEFVAAGAITGALYKANLGLAATLVGAGLGATLSLLGGLIIVGILKATDVSIQDIREAFYKIKLHREKQMDEVYEKSAVIKYDKFTKHHDALVDKIGEKRIEEI